MRTIFITLTFLIVSGLLFGLEVGDKAPPIKVAKWLVGSGSTPDKPDGKSIYVVEFWATWSKACKVTIPRINQLHTRLKDKGVVIMSISSEKEETVASFLKGAPVTYNIAIDDNGATSSKYMAGIGSMPHAFVIDKTGSVVWHGSPLEGLELVVAKVLDGSFDAKAAVVTAKIMEKFQKAMKERNVEAGLAALEELIAAQPDNPRGYAYKVQMLNQLRAFDKIPAVFAAWEKGCRDSAEGLSTLAMALISQENPALKNPSMAYRAAKRSYELRPENGPIAFTLARVYAEIGLVDKAIETLEKAAAKAKGQEAAFINTTLAYYKKVQEARKEARKSEK